MESQVFSMGIALLFKRRIEISLEWIKRFGVFSYLGHVISGLLKISRLDKPVVFQTLMKNSQSIETEVLRIVNLKEVELVKIKREMAILEKEIKSRIELGFFPENWNSGVETAKLLYVLVRANKFQRVLEIGTGNGISTFALSRALKMNTPSSKLLTVDVNVEAGSVLKHEDPENVEFAIIDSSLSSKRKFFANESAFSPDLVFIDGAHDYLNVINDLELVFSLKPRLIIADDIEVNEAWFDFCRKNTISYRVFIDKRKVLGYFYN